MQFFFYRFGVIMNCHDLYLFFIFKFSMNRENIKIFICILSKKKNQNIWLLINYH